MLILIFFEIYSIIILHLYNYKVPAFYIRHKMEKKIIIKNNLTNFQKQNN